MLAAPKFGLEKGAGGRFGTRGWKAGGGGGGGSSLKNGPSGTILHGRPKARPKRDPCTSCHMALSHVALSPYYPLIPSLVPLHKARKRMSGTKSPSINSFCFCIVPLVAPPSVDSTQSSHFPNTT